MIFASGYTIMSPAASGGTADQDHFTAIQPLSNIHDEATDHFMGF